MLDTKNAYDVAAHVAKSTHILQELYNDKTVEGVSRYENIQELLNGIKEFSTEDVVDDEDNINSDRGLGSYLQNISLLTGDEKAGDDEETVKLMTIHAAKGLEFPVVFVVGLEENLFPSAMSLYTREDLEEERRLFYVAITRAEKHLFISFANTRYKFGTLQYCEPSRFLKELPEKDLQIMGAPERRPSSSAGLTSTKSSGSLSATRKTSESGLNPRSLERRKAQLIRRPNAQNTSSENFVPDDPKDFKNRPRSATPKVCNGKVTNIAEGTNAIATILFKHEGEKKIMLKFAKLKILS